MDVTFDYSGDKASAITLLQQLIEGLPEHLPSRINMSLVPANGNGAEQHMAPAPTPSTIFNKERFSELLVESGLSQRQFATILHGKGYRTVSQSRVSAWKTGRMTPDITRISVIAECLGVPVTEITK